MSWRFSATGPHSSPGKVHPLQERLESFTACTAGPSVKPIVLRLNTVYMWMSEAFAALDLHKTGHICLETQGPLIQQALAGAGLQPLWHSLTSGIQNRGASEDAFMHVCIHWMGLQDSWAVSEGLQRSRSFQVLGALSQLSLLISPGRLMLGSPYLENPFRTFTVLHHARATHARLLIIILRLTMALFQTCFLREFLCPVVFIARRQQIMQPNAVCDCSRR